MLHLFQERKPCLQSTLLAQREEIILADPKFGNVFARLVFGAPNSGERHGFSAAKGQLLGLAAGSVLRHSHISQLQSKTLVGTGRINANVLPWHSIENMDSRPSGQERLVIFSGENGQFPHYAPRLPVISSICSQA